MGSESALPAGTVTFLFTDVESSTRLLGQHPAAYRDAVRRHHDLLRAAVEGHGGAVFETVGDAVYAAFAHATDAVAAALAGQLALAGEPRVRLAQYMVTGERELRRKLSQFPRGSTFRVFSIINDEARTRVEFAIRAAGHRIEETSSSR